jgi:hypothetical protein
MDSGEGNPSQMGCPQRDPVVYLPQVITMPHASVNVQTGADTGILS